MTSAGGCYYAAMPISQEIAERKARLDAELSEADRKAYGLAKSAYLWSQFLFILALCCSVAAVVSGVFFNNISPKIPGGIAALPPLIAFVAINLKLEARSSWHYRKSYAMAALRSRLRFQLPEDTTAEHISAIAQDRDDVIDQMELEWDQTITVNWGEMLKQQPKISKRRSNEP
jgi:hypothetical protein